LVATRREGQFVHYSLADPSVADFLRSLQTIARQQLAGVRETVKRYFDEPEAFEPVTVNELVELMRTDAVTVLDVRPGDEYAAGHIPGAVSIPVEELESRIAELPRAKEVIAYCRGPYCVFAPRAVGALRAKGFRARRLEEGVPDWRALGFDVAVEAS
jgi:ArsR family transcriptional regulator